MLRIILVKLVFPELSHLSDLADLLSVFEVIPSLFRIFDVKSTWRRGV
jgi:hypothetical protein